MSDLHTVTTRGAAAEREHTGDVSNTDELGWLKTSTAARGTLEDRFKSDAATAIAALLARSHDEWQRTFGSMKPVLDGLQRACEAALSQQAPDASVTAADLAAKLAGAARTDADAAVQRVQAESQRAIAELQARLAALEAELQAAAEAVKTAEALSEDERRVRRRAETALTDSQRARDQLVEAHARELAELRSELATVRSELDAERADRRVLKQQVADTLRMALDSLQGQPPPPTPSGPGRGPASGGDPDRGSASGPSVNAVEPSPHSGSATDACTAIPRALKLVHDAHGMAAAPIEDEDAEATARALLADAEAAYQSDLDENRTPTEIVDRLTGHLAHAERELAARVGGGAARAFKQELIALLNARAESRFGRHLSIAMYELYRDESSSTNRVA